MVACPTDGNCTIQCLDSFSCDGTVINAYSSSTELHCVASDLNQSNICTNGVRINVETSMAKSVRLNCSNVALNPSAQGIVVCDHISVTQLNHHHDHNNSNPNSTVNATTMTNETALELAFFCTGNGINCDAIDINVTDSTRLDITGIGAGSSLNASRFLHSGDLNLTVRDGMVVSNNVFASIGSSDNDTNLTVSSLLDSRLQANKFLLSGGFDRIAILNIAGDASNTLHVDNVAQLVIECSEHSESDCGGFGTFYVNDSLQLLNVSAAPHTTFASCAIEAANEIDRVSMTFARNASFESVNISSPALGQLSIHGNAQRNNDALQVLVESDDIFWLLLHGGVFSNLHIDSVQFELPQPINAINVSIVNSTCTNLTVSGTLVATPRVSVTCSNSTCDSLRINNLEGASLLTINATGNLTNAYVTGDPLLISAHGAFGHLSQCHIDASLISDVLTLNASDAFVIESNVFELNHDATAMFTTSGDVSFLQNIIRSPVITAAPFEFNFNLSISAEHVEFNKTANQTYNFNAADMIIMSLNASQALKNSMIHVYDANASMMITNDGGVFFGNTITSQQRNLFSMSCLGMCEGPLDQHPKNSFNLPSVSDAVFVVGAGGIWNQEYIDINVAENASISLVAQAGGTIFRVPVNDALSVSLENDHNSSLTYGVMIAPLAKAIYIDAETAGLQVTANVTGYSFEKRNIWNTEYDHMHISSTFEFELNGTALYPTSFIDNVLVIDLFSTVSFVGDDNSQVINNGMQIYTNQNHTQETMTADIVLSVISAGVAYNGVAFAFSVVDGVAYNFPRAYFVNLSIADSKFNMTTFAHNNIDARNVSEFLVSGHAYNFTHNNVKLNQNGIFNLSGTGATQALQNIFMSSANSNFNNLTDDIFMLSMWNMNAMGVSFVQSDAAFTFDHASNISLQGALSNKRVDFLNNASTVNITSLVGGRFLNNSIHATQLDTLHVVLNGNNAAAVASPNVYNIDNVRNTVSFNVSFPDAITAENTRFNFTDVGAFELYVYNGSNVSDVMLSGLQVRDTLLIANYNGTMNNVSVYADYITTFVLSCLGGCQYTTVPNTFSLGAVLNVSLILNAANNDRMDLSAMQKMSTVSPAATVYMSSAGSGTNVSGAMFTQLNAPQSFVLEAFGGRFENMQIDATYSVEINAKNGGHIDNVRVTPDKIESIIINNQNASITALTVVPQTAVHSIVVGNFGELSHSMIDAETAQILNILCAPNADGNGHYDDASDMVYCNNLTVWVPEPSSSSGNHTDASLICSNTGCQNIVFHTENSIDDIGITLRDCPCETAVASSCVNEQFTIYCEASEDVPSIFSQNKCSGKCCGDIVDDLKITSCDYSTGGKKKSKTGAIVGGVCGALIGVVLIAFGFYYWKKRKTLAEEEVRQPLNS
eukprot:CAMPEP_0202690584 /NCGR_PEP_ID=MMETSP1385-20130828/5529_1 /ASSEMBLY_ACC=CAM_ASM_000861 /TAXON_ID=933848 /ORGANISM="Elphidium margaritaceum" /LENGTH=1398 /DNA_ID=CAMNT_0049345859 /DNA_START=234 /DNA_END=4430 /DNA_ORIENTATION=-